MTGADSAGVVLSPQEVLELLPQKEPFRFVDEIIEVDEAHIKARYRFRPEADFYRGHFPDNPVTPGVSLLEAIAQVGVVALGIFLIAQDGGRAEVERRVSVFTDAEVDFCGIVKPGDAVTISATKVFFRRGKLRSKAEMTLDGGSVVCTATVSGIGVLQ